tara:strand:+ start:179 stop:886 length:708 start_codon:yes stop_codon:yes gene_type:complete
MKNIEQVVFFWIGKNLDIPSLLVKSINFFYEKNINIIQLSDKETKKVQGVSKVIRKPIKGKLMVDRLYLYSFVDTEDRLTLFLDADSLVIKKLNLDDFSNGCHLLERNMKKSSIINHTWPETYPEFNNKSFQEMMPFLFGIIIINRHKNFFNEVLKILLKLPERFHRWYGDQYSLVKFYNKNRKQFSKITEDWAQIISLNKQGGININASRNTKVLTFKGNTKLFIKPVLEKLIK